jgi:hypothetical protein
MKMQVVLSDLGKKDLSELLANAACALKMKKCCPTSTALFATSKSKKRVV